MSNNEDWDQYSGIIYDNITSSQPEPWIIVERGQKTFQIREGRKWQTLRSYGITKIPNGRYPLINFLPIRPEKKYAGFFIHSDKNNAYFWLLEPVGIWQCLKLSRVAVGKIKEGDIISIFITSDCNPPKKRGPGRPPKQK
jgi:hypothetical protein